MHLPGKFNFQLKLSVNHRVHVEFKMGMKDFLNRNFTIKTL